MAEPRPSLLKTTKSREQAYFATEEDLNSYLRLDNENHNVERIPVNEKKMWNKEWFAMKRVIAWEAGESWLDKRVDSIRKVN